MTPERRKTILIVAGTLIIGILIGVLGSGMYARKHYGGPGPRGEMQRGGRGDFAKRLIHIVEADSNQSKAMKPILDETMSKIDGVQSHTREEIKKIIDSLDVKLEPVLRPEQLERLKKFHEENRKRFRERGEGRKSREERK
jgi:hypothetical protein